MREFCNNGTGVDTLRHSLLTSIDLHASTVAPTLPSHHLTPCHQVCSCCSTPCLASWPPAPGAPCTPCLASWPHLPGAPRTCWAPGGPTSRGSWRGLERSSWRGGPLSWRKIWSTGIRKSNLGTLKDGRKMTLTSTQSAWWKGKILTWGDLWKKDLALEDSWSKILAHQEGWWKKRMLALAEIAWWKGSLDLRAWWKERILIWDDSWKEILMPGDSWKGILGQGRDLWRKSSTHEAIWREMVKYPSKCLRPTRGHMAFSFTV